MSAMGREPPVAIVAAGDEETLLLLRSLLRVHHIRVEGEARGAGVASRLLTRLHPEIVLVDSELQEGAWSELLVRTRAEIPGARFILVTAEALRSTKEPAPDVVLVRPFRIRDFADALGPAGDGDSSVRSP